MAKHLLAAIALIVAVFTAFPASAYLLPPCSISREEAGVPAETVLAGVEAELGELAASVNVSRIDDHRRNTKIRLAPRERKVAKRYDHLLAKIDFWNDVIRLKTSLSALHGASPPAGAVVEADTMAKDVIEALYDLSQKWRIGSSALLNNMMINLGLKEKGFCYHFASHLRKVLAQRTWSWFETRWGIAWPNNFRESNALVITAKGKPFETGIAIDPWRTAGRPFWTAVKGDRFPWVEGYNVEKEYDVE